MTKAFTLYALALNNLGHTGEGVKAKNKNCLTRARGAPLRSSPRTDAHSHSQPGRTRDAATDLLEAMEMPTPSSGVAQCSVTRRAGSAGGCLLQPKRAPQVKKEAFHGQTVVGGMLLR